MSETKIITEPIYDMVPIGKVAELRRRLAEADARIAALVELVQGVVEADRIRDLVHSGLNPDGTRQKPYAWQGLQEDADIAVSEAVERLVSGYRALAAARPADAGEGG